MMGNGQDGNAFDRWAEVGYRVVVPDDHSVELWHRDRFVARFTPSVSLAGLVKAAADDWLVMIEREVFGW